MCEIISFEKHAHTLTTATETCSTFSSLRSRDKALVLERGIPPSNRERMELAEILNADERPLGLLKCNSDTLYVRPRLMYFE